MRREGAVRKNASRAVMYIFLIAASLISVFPLYWSFISAFNNTQQILGGWMLPSTHLFENLQHLFEQHNVMRALKNSFATTILQTVLALAVSSIAGYGFEIISRNTSLPVGSTVMAIDVAVCALSAPVFSIENALYAGLSMVISGYVIDAVVDGGNKRRMVLIISDKFPDIAADIMYGLGRGCTKFKATGMYSGAEKPVIMVIVSRRELNTLKTIVRERDPHAIVTVADVTEAFGEGFKDISA